jgi:hypothetical protein
MHRAYFYVVLSGERWAVRLSGRPIPELFDRKAQAIHAAVEAAQDHWRQTGQPTGVRIQLSNGHWENERNYGDDPEPSAATAPTTSTK